MSEEKKTNEKGCAYGQVLENRVSTLERERFEDRKVLHEIRDKLLGRPSWAVCVVITVLSSVTMLSLGTMIRLWFIKGNP